MANDDSLSSEFHYIYVIFFDQNIIPTSQLEVAVFHIFQMSRTFGPDLSASGASLRWFITNC